MNPFIDRCAPCNFSPLRCCLRPEARHGSRAERSGKLRSQANLTAAADPSKEGIRKEGIRITASSDADANPKANRPPAVRKPTGPPQADASRKEPSAVPPDANDPLNEAAAGSGPAFRSRQTIGIFSQKSSNKSKGSGLSLTPNPLTAPRRTDPPESSLLGRPTLQSVCRMKLPTSPRLRRPGNHPETGCQNPRTSTGP